jgi:outer membrane protein assembly factor BamA
MDFYRRVKLVLFLAVISWVSAFAQNKDSLHGKKIIIASIKAEGNNITKTSILLRELTFKKGDSIPAAIWAVTSLRSKNNIMNTGLFNFADIDTSTNAGGGTDITIVVVEQWYIWPYPEFQLEERNFNVWWNQDHRSLNKVDYGAFLSDNNTTGNKEVLKVKVQLGYTQQLGLSYNIPYITKNQNLGLQFNITYSQNKEIAYTSVGNILTFLSTPNATLQDQVTSALDLTYRQGLYNTHYLEVNFAACTINDTILKLTKDYLPFNLTNSAFFGGKYYFRRDLRDYAPYPLRGYYCDFSLNDFGMGLALPKERAFNILYTQASFHKYFKVTNKIFFSAEAEGKVSQNEIEPYYLQRGLGYGNDFVRGYEYYVIDGNNYALGKGEIKYQLINIPQIKLPTQSIPFFRQSQFNKANFALYLTAFSDWGYVGQANPNVVNNFLAKAPLWGNGVGIDMVTYYGIVVRFEYSFNQLDQSGFFLHFLADM